MRYDRRTLLLPAVLLALLLPAHSGAMETEGCLACHGDTTMVGANLHIDALTFGGTAHAGLGCVSCHGDISANHPDDGLAAEKVSCIDCHQDIAAEYANSSHAAYAACIDCHDPHSAYGPTQIAGFDMNHKCGVCHGPEEMLLSHKQWLPQAELHLGKLPCVTCHTSSENYVITFYLNKRQPGQPLGALFPATPQELRDINRGRDMFELIDTNRDDFISLTELRAFNTNPEFNKALRLYGMMTPELVTHSFATLDNRWDCSFCHASGPGAMQRSFVAFPQGHGSYTRLPVERGAVLDALYGTPDFYILGATRSSALNIVGLLIIAGGLVMPIGHGALRFLTRNNRKDHQP